MRLSPPVALAPRRTVRPWASVTLALASALALAACQQGAGEGEASPAASEPPAPMIARAAPEAVAPEAAAQNIVYRCADGRRVAARYEGQRAVLSLDGGDITVSLHPAASGARYVGAGTQWWTRGMDQASLALLAEGETYAKPDAGVSCTAEQPAASAGG